MIESVMLKLKSCAFSITPTIDGGAKEAIRARDLAVAEESDRGTLVVCKTFLQLLATEPEAHLPSLATLCTLKALWDLLVTSNFISRLGNSPSSRFSMARPL